jgi:Ca2+-binding EF-hand superfamily protein
MLEAAHRSREARGLYELPLEVFDVLRGAEAGVAQGRGLFDGFEAAAAPPVIVLRPVLAIPVGGPEDSPWGQDSPMPTKPSLPPYTVVRLVAGTAISQTSLQCSLSSKRLQALSSLVAQYGSGVVFDEATLRELYAIFQAKTQDSIARGLSDGAAAHHQLTHDEFVSAMGRTGTPGNVAHQLFAAMDRDASGTISFDEMAVGLAVLARGDLRAKLSLAFSAFDLDKSGTCCERGCHFAKTGDVCVFC